MMNLEKYILPIYSGNTIVGQGFVADGYFVTAAHVIMDFPSCYTMIMKRKFVFSNPFSEKKPVFKGKGDVYHDPFMMDVVLFPCEEISSPLTFSGYVPSEGDILYNYCMHEVMDFSNPNPPCKLCEIPAKAYGKEEGNYFFCDCKQFGGSSGSPLLKGHEVVGIMHGGNDEGLCAFFKGEMMSKLLPQIELDNLNTGFNKWDMEDAYCDTTGKYSADKKRLFRGFGSNINEGTIVICNEACKWTDCETIIIPDSVKKIGDKAFYVSHGLQYIEIPNSVIEIGREAFWCCSSLYHIVLSNSITRISNNMFGGCQSLEHIIIPDSVIEIEDWAFSGCENLIEIAIPESVKEIGDWAFNDCKSLARIILPCSINSIGKDIFSCCDDLSQIYIPKGSNDKFRSLLPDYVDLFVEEDESILKNGFNRYPFGDSYSLKEIWEVSNPGLYEEIDGDVAEVVEVVDEGQCYLRIEIPFKDGSTIQLKLATTDYEEGDKIIVSTIKGQEFDKVGSDPIVRYFGDLYFSTEVTEEDLENAWTDEYGVKYSADRKRLLKAPTEIRSYFIKNGTNIICNKSFQSTLLAQVIIPNSVLSIGDNAFSGCCLTSIEIPDNVKNIGEWTFSYNKLYSVVIPKSVKHIGIGAFGSCGSITNISVDIKNEFFDSRNDCNAIIETKTNTLIVGCQNTIIPNNVTSIEKWAFSGCSNLSYISIPKEVLYIGLRAFRWCI